MDVDKVLEVANSLVFAKTRRRFSSVEAAILSGFWQGETYKEIANAVSLRKCQRRDSTGSRFSDCSALPIS